MLKWGRAVSPTAAGVSLDSRMLFSVGPARGPPGRRRTVAREDGAARSEPWKLDQGNPTLVGRLGRYRRISGGRQQKSYREIGLLEILPLTVLPSFVYVCHTSL